MPIHDWTRVDAGLFHAFHQQWITNLCVALNGGLLPPEFFALPEQDIGPIPDVLTLRLAADDQGPDQTGGGVAVATAPPRARVIQRHEGEVYARKANRIAVRHRHGQVVAVIEIVSPGNKGSKSELRAFVEKSADLIRQGVHLLVIDLFPPTKRDPRGIHAAIWDEISEEDFTPPADKPLTAASYDAGPPRVAYVEPLAVGDELPSLPIFLRPEWYVPAPLASSYQATWNVFPAIMRKLLDGPR
jgi:hypothetical protein